MSSPNDIHNGQPAQVLLRMQYRQMLAQGLPMPSFKDVEFRAYSQNCEDGILLFLFSILGATNKRCLEICAGDGIQCNTTNLILNHGWHGVLIDGNAAKLEKGRAFYAKHPDTRVWPPVLAAHWITRDNINDLVRDHQCAGDIDLLSLDMDGNDYWIWQALTVVRPRIVILEYQSAWGPERSVSQKYIEDFNFHDVQVGGTLPRCGASLSAFVKLAKGKGYRLVGCESRCFNAVFIKDGLGEEWFPEVPASQCFDHPMQGYRMALLEGNEHLLPDMWEEV